MGLGGEGVLRTSGREDEAYKVIHCALDLGINYFESARAYSGSESYYGLALKERRRESYLEEGIPLALEKHMGVVAMKVYFRGLAARLPWFSGMEPFFRFALSQTVTTAVIGCNDIRQVQENTRFAATFHPMPEGEKQGLIDKIEPYARQLMYYEP